MTSVAETRRRKKARSINGADTPDTHATPQGKPTARPTPERWARGNWAEATGAGRDARPLVDLSSDLMGKLYRSGQITNSQHEAARRFQEIREAFLAELGTASFKSCLAGGSGGHDSGDGDAEVMRRYKRISQHLGSRLRVLVDNVHKLPHERVTNLSGLKLALDCLSGIDP